jgi:hypothetical protein
MRLGCPSVHTLFSPHVQFAIADCEPEPAARLERIGLLNFDQAEHAAIELSRGRFLRARYGNLHVVNADDHCFSCGCRFTLATDNVVLYGIINGVSRCCGRL